MSNRNRNEHSDSGWCVNWLTCPSTLFCPCVNLRGALMCVPCGARDVGLPKGATAEQVIAEADLLDALNHHTTGLVAPVFSST